MANSGLYGSPTRLSAERASSLQRPRASVRQPREWWRQTKGPFRGTGPVGVYALSRRLAAEDESFVEQGLPDLPLHPLQAYSLQLGGGRNVTKITNRDQPKREPSKMPSGGPHAESDLMNPDATPGAGSLPPIGGNEGENVQPTS
jgi:hypothetical protein